MRKIIFGVMLIGLISLLALSTPTDALRHDLIEDAEVNITDDNEKIDEYEIHLKTKNGVISKFTVYGNFTQMLSVGKEYEIKIITNETNYTDEFEYAGGDITLDLKDDELQTIQLKEPIEYTIPPAQDLPRYYQFQYISYFSTWILVLSPIPAIALYIRKRMQ
jgi:hypothetical protein